MKIFSKGKKKSIQNSQDMLADINSHQEKPEIIKNKIIYCTKIKDMNSHQRNYKNKYLVCTLIIENSHKTIIYPSI